MKNGPVGALSLVILAASCLDVAENRAKGDFEVGQAALGDARISVSAGLAAVRHFEALSIGLWAGAPALSIELETGASGSGVWEVRIENTLADAALRAVAKGATGDTTIPVELVASPFPTEHTWRFEAPAGAHLTLSLAAPDAEDPAPWRFAAFADVQEALPEVQDIYAKMNDTPGIRFALISGDLTSRGKRDELETFQREMKTLAFPCYATLGNHDIGTNDDLFHDYYGRGSFSFDFRSVRFTLLDSASATIDPLAREWLDGWLEGGRDMLHVVAMHIPPIDPVGARNGSFSNRAEADDLLLDLARGNVDLTLYGHIHSYYTYENAGIPAHISGGGGAIPERLDGIGRHFLTIDVRPPGKIEQVAIVRVD